MREFSFDNKKIHIGENAQENTNLIFKYKKLNDPFIFWFHLKDVPSPHLILFNDSYDLPKNILDFCGNLLKSFSKKEYRYSIRSIQCTNLNNVLLTKTPGLVQIYNKKNLKTFTPKK